MRISWSTPLLAAGRTLSLRGSPGGVTFNSVAENVVGIDLGVTWEPNAPEAWLVSDDNGRAALALKAHRDDPDRRCVVLIWSGVHSSWMADPNDEALSGHRLYSRGLREVLWAGVVRESDSVRALERQNRVHPSHDPSRFARLIHYVIPLKECVVEVIASAVAVQRVAGTTLDALTTAMGADRP